MKVIIQEPLSREVFWHEYAKIPRVARKNPIAEGDFYWIFARNCEGTEQLRCLHYTTADRFLFARSARLFIHEKTPAIRR